VNKTEANFSLLSYTPDWMKRLFFGALALLQTGAGFAYAQAPKGAEGGFRVDAITVMALASPVVTLIIGGMTIVSKQHITERQMELESRHGDREQEINARQKALDIRLALLERGIPCEHKDCPVVEVATGKRRWDQLPPMRPRHSREPVSPVEPAEGDKDDEAVC